MKKTFIVLAAMLVTSIAAKAWEVGDFYVDPNGVPSMVIYVDSTGEHGLRMAPIALNDSDLLNIQKIYAQKAGAAKGNIETRKKMEEDPKLYKRLMKASKGQILDIMDSVIYEYEHTYEAAEYTLDFIEKFPRAIHHNYWQYLKKKDLVQMIEQIENGAYGEINTKEIIRYCEENEINLERTFPHIYYAAQLGPNWFVPGTNELELVSKILTKGVGQYTEQKEYYAQKLSAYNKKVGYLKIFFPIKSIKSSTLIAGSWGHNEEALNKMNDNYDRVNQRFYSLNFEWWAAGAGMYSKEKRGHVCYFFAPDVSGDHTAFCRF